MCVAPDRAIRADRGGVFVGLMWSFFGRVGLMREAIEYMSENREHPDWEIVAIPVLILAVAAFYAGLVYGLRQIVEREGSRSACRPVQPLLRGGSFSG